MKKITLTIVAIVFSTTFFAQSYSTGVVNFGGSSIEINVNAATNIVTATMTGPSDRYFAFGFGVQGMNESNTGDCVMYLGGTGATALSDRAFNGNTSIPTLDAVQSWTVTSNTVASGVRTLIATRARISVGDYTFPATATAINLAWSVTGVANYILQYHGGARGGTTANLTLGNGKFETESFKMSPNPANDFVSIQLPDYVTSGTVKMYDAIGRVVKMLDITTNIVDVNTQQFAKGSYLVVVRTEFGNSTKTLILN